MSGIPVSCLSCTKFDYESDTVTGGCTKKIPVDLRARKAKTCEYYDQMSLSNWEYQSAI